MAKWVHADVLDNGLQYIKTNANRLWLLKAYAAGDSYATATGNMIAEATMASGDYTLGNGASSSRTLTSISPASEVEITLSADDNAMRSVANAAELRRVTVVATYGSGADQVTGEHDYAVNNLAFVG